ncbi:MAG: adenine phosphoribosyltransferase [Myxococcota bacterium]
MNAVADRIKGLIKDVPDFPKPGIIFKDLTPVFQDPAVHRAMVKAFAERYRAQGIEAIVAIESRGFLIGAPLALELDISLAIVRKPGKLPRETLKRSYDLEYGQDTLEMHADALTSGQKVVVVDDLLATGGTANAAVELAAEVGANVVETAFMVELTFLKGREKLSVPSFALVEY